MGKHLANYLLFEAIRDRIVHGDYRPNMILSEKDLCEEFKVSRTPLREAILKLKDMKLVSAIPGSGTFVTPINVDEIRSSFQVKIKLEELVGELAAKHISTPQLESLNNLIVQADHILEEATTDRHRELIGIDLRFHEIMCEAAQNEILKEFQENLHSRCARLWSSSLSRIVPNEEVISQLKGVYLAVKKGDSDEAGRLMGEHVQYFIAKIRGILL